MTELRDMTAALQGSQSDLLLSYAACFCCLLVPCELFAAKFRGLICGPCCTVC